MGIKCSLYKYCDPIANLEVIFYSLFILAYYYRKTTK